MLRRLLTCLAILTGLAAVGAPASAAIGDNLASQVGASLTQAEAGCCETSGCSDESRETPARQPSIPAPKQKRTVTVYIPTVQFGADRAIE